MMRLTHNRVAASRLLALGALLVALMAAFVMLAEGPAHASTTFYVNSTADHADANPFDGFCDTGHLVPGTTDTMEAECTLRAAIQQANYTSGADIINGYSQPGASPNTLGLGNDAVLKIELSGANA